jgi:hypothetical protein
MGSEMGRECSTNAKEHKPVRHFDQKSLRRKRPLGTSEPRRLDDIKLNRRQMGSVRIE